MPLSNFKPAEYARQLDDKVAAALCGFKDLFQGRPLIVPSPVDHYRMRAEFRMWHSGERIDFVMFRPGFPRDPHIITDFPVASRHISERMPKLKQLLDDDPILRKKLFQCEFLTTFEDDTLLTLIYHKRLDEHWQQVAKKIQVQLGVKIIGRSRKQKLPLTEDFVTEHLCIGGRRYSYRQTEGVFTQPNGPVNRQMIEWTLSQLQPTDSDLLELYCGTGNFSLPLAQRFRRVLATEISKQAVACARHNVEINGIDNLTLLRMSSEEFSQAIDGLRPFRRLRDIDLDALRLNTVLVDPPRAGLDPATLGVIQRIERIVYISCNPESLLANLAHLSGTHRICKLAFFDQFPYTPHLECGVILEKTSGR